MDLATLSFLHKTFQEVQRKQDWRAALDTLFVSLRGSFVFDNAAIYLEDSQTKASEVVYARAVGRGKAAEADSMWGEGIANEVLSKGKMILKEPRKGLSYANRLTEAHLLGFPLYVGGNMNGALVFIRFGGPQYTELHIQIASLQAFWATALIERKELQDARTELDSVQRQMRLQDDFVSTISHELRTPLGFIKGYSTSLLRQDTTWDDSTQREFLNIIDEEADRLARLIENMLESARLQSQTLQFKFSPVRIDALARDVAMRIHTHHPEMKVNFDVETLPSIRGDGMRIAQVFENLFSNALKYAPASEINIGMRLMSDKIRVTFADNGEGIPEDYLPFLFERFYRVPGERTVTGTGLGLYICKQIVMAHHGNIWVESVLDKGTTFIIELPVDPTL
ncbi:MAG: GAF domain-containing sensor histidine kinase [Anaerolineales bacterium]|jgi:signal transduction histidine kinase|uniref:GAF domain-containing sensor histidine kinase n=1 Tax=Candidatus Villigracilis affinis TaxID=3140682 RepID=UPI001B4A10E7|nr:GAF domain-containing sensor histidine kinase [Anaerolineales bacterium]MBK9602902.1 GAF domain-containing sensor histidine kinase [Anaerolineales bacterium]MBL0346074.1 GAF domain-containing sensor histidine kinase [Anaerolineales bacterium]MBP8047562.1 GAF domain-containing sensor histidine kinase [Anaerolineales bacterium]